jgi:NhaA family Na+:H+ antiporter
MSSPNRAFPWPVSPAYVNPFQVFIRLEAAGGIVLLFSAAIALIWANSSVGATYEALWATPFDIGIAGLELHKPILLWINDGLMAIFFFLVGLEIKRELFGGELASPRQAALPLAAALGGMIVPALIYSLFNFGTEGRSGWGIPMATDIAFALGVLALLVKRVPLSLKIFLSALAIVDDLGAVLVIALFYTEAIAFGYLAGGLGLLGASWLANRLGIRRTTVYVVLGLAVWVLFLKSGVHATVAGVLLALTIPIHTRVNVPQFLDQSASLLDLIRREHDGPDRFPTSTQREAIQGLEVLCEHIESPLQRMERALHGWVAFGIMPLFALANAGVVLDGAGAGANAIGLGVAAGLVFGKPIGVVAFSWLAVRQGIAILPSGLTWGHIRGAACLAGIGFTMSLFISGLAFGDHQMLASAKLGILGASVVSGILGWLILIRQRPVGDTDASPNP